MPCWIRARAPSTGRRRPTGTGRPPGGGRWRAPNAWIAEHPETRARRGKLAAAPALPGGGRGRAFAGAGGGGGAGCAVPVRGDPFASLFSESAARAVVAVRPGSEAAVTDLCAEWGVPAAVIGVTGGASLEVA